MRATCSDWNGPGWYAPCQEGAHDNQHIKWYWISDDPTEEPDTGDAVVGTPSWFDTLFEIEGERANY